MARVSFCIITIFLILISFSSWGESTQGFKNSKLKFKHLQVEHGLSSNVTSCILQDRRGFLWFGTDAGLNRYDGFQIKTYKDEGDHKNDLSNGVIKCLFEDKQGRIWIGTERGLNCYIPEIDQFKFYLSIKNDINSLSNNTITSITQDKFDNIWVGTFSGLNKLTGFTKDKEPLFKRVRHHPQIPESLSNNRIFCLTTDKEGNLWVGTEGGGLNLIKVDALKNDKEIFTHFTHLSNETRSIADNTIYNIYQVEDGRLYIGTDKGLSVLEKKDNQYYFYNYPKTEKERKKFKEHKIYSLGQDQENQIWIGTFGDGLIRINPKEDKYITYQHEPYNKQSLSRNFIFSIYSSKEGILWLATRETGIDRIDPNVQRFIHLKHIPNNKNSLSNNVIKSITEGSDGRFWFGTYGGGLNVYDPITDQFRNYKHSPSNTNSLSSNIIESIAFDHLNRLWIGTLKGLNLFEPEKEKFTRFEHDPTHQNSIANNNIWFVLPSKDKKGLWISTYNGLDKYDWEKDKFYHFKNNPNDPTSLSFNFTREVLEDKDQNLWVSTWGGGLDKLDLKKNTELGKAQFEHYRHISEDKRSISSDLVNVTFSDSKGNLWVGTQGGLNLFLKGSENFIRYTKNDGLADNVIKGILEDQEGYLWISTQKGMSKFNPETKTFTNYFQKDGLQGDIFNLSSCLLNSQKEMMFGGNNGVSIFKPEEFTERTNFPPAYINQLKVNNQLIRTGKIFNGRIPINKTLSSKGTIELKHNENTINIEFSAIEYSSPEKIKFTYILEGADTSWNHTDYKNRQVTYSVLKPGKYRFRVKTSNVGGEWNDEETHLSILITPPFWATSQAYLIYILMVLVLISYISSFLRNRIRIKKELQLEKEEHKKRNEINKFKLQFFTNISHEIRTPLTLISLPLQKLMEEGNQLSHTQKQTYFQSIDRNVNSLLHLINQLLDFRKVESNKISIHVKEGDICQLITPIIQSFSTSSIQKRIMIHFESTVNKFMVYTDNNIIEKILNNLLSNALKFTPIDGTIHIRLHTSNEVQIPSNMDIRGKNSDYFCISLKDTGIGMQESQIESIFERFTQLPQNSSTSTGTGIGLALSKKLINTHKGYIAVESKPGEGSTFYIWLPIDKSFYKEDEIATDNLSLANSKKEKTTAFSNPKLSELDKMDSVFNKEIKTSKEHTLLIVEDNDEMRLHIKEILKHKYHILEACNGQEGLEIALSKGPDLVITDVMMPVMNGLDFCNNLKKDLRISHIPLIMLTAKSTIEHEIEGLEQGADQYISKPFKLNHLKLVVRNLLTTQKQLQVKFTGKRNIPSPKEINVTSTDERMFEEMIETIEKHLSDPDFTVEELANTLGLSSVHLYRKLKSIAGITPNKFIRLYRLKSASQLLKQNKLRITEVGYIVGFSDPKYFRKCFKNEYGKSPSEYAKEFS